MDISCILPNLFVGPSPQSPRDIDQLKRDYKISALLNVQTDDDMADWGIDLATLETYYHKLKIEIWRIPVQDFDPDDLRSKLPECVEALDDLLQLGHKVYVHCSMGVNRSPTIVIAYLTWIKGWDLEEAYDHVTRIRSCDPYVEAIRLAGEERG
ncbi:MAG: dual specificity protein phosphatase family protein [Thermoguttaceae bacterium]|jgi:protein-tyrosine phosphatase